MSVSRKFWLLCLFCLIVFPLFSQAVYLELNLNESNSVNPFSRSRQPLEVFRVIEKAASDDKVHGIILNIASFSSDRNYLWELRSALEKFKSGGKKICAYINYADMDVYTLASVADKIVMDRLGTLNIGGYAVGGFYVQRTLEKLGIGVRELRYFEYKSAAEMFTRNSMSQADRRQYNEYLDDIFNLTRAALINARNWTNEEFDIILNREFLYSAMGALDRALVDRTGGKDDILEMVNELEGAQVNNFVLYGNAASSLTGSRISYAPSNAGGLFKRPPVIAVVYADGNTEMESGMSALSLSNTVRELADNQRVKAIVVRINSPGGSAEAAEYLSEAIRYAKTKKPVVVSMGQVAASGGYWAAINASHIMAAPYTITGSIGVISYWFYDNGLNNNLGLTTDLIQRGAHADLFTGIIIPYRNLTDAEEERYKSYIIDAYNIFVDKVASARGMTFDRVNALAQGRIYSGIKALEVGLIDSIGSLADAVSLARELANIPEGTNVAYREYPEPTFLERFLSRFPFASVFFKNRGSQTNAFSAVTDFFLPDMDISYRLKNNGKVMPLLPLGWQTGE